MVALLVGGLLVLRQEVEALLADNGIEPPQAFIAALNEQFKLAVRNVNGVDESSYRLFYIALQNAHMVYEALRRYVGDAELKHAVAIGELRPTGLFTDTAVYKLQHVHDEEEECSLIADQVYLGQKGVLVTNSREADIHGEQSYGHAMDCIFACLSEPNSFSEWREDVVLVDEEFDGEADFVFPAYKTSGSISMEDLSLDYTSIEHARSDWLFITPTLVEKLCAAELFAHAMTEKILSPIYLRKFTFHSALEQVQTAAVYFSDLIARGLNGISVDDSICNKCIEDMSNRYARY